MLGYWDDEAATARAIDVARWMHTGDLAMMNADGYVSISGRIDDMIIRAGENIYRIEQVQFRVQSEQRTRTTSAKYLVKSQY